jgi:phospholipid-binding lipoprotein MlaA
MRSLLRILSSWCAIAAILAVTATSVIAAPTDKAWPVELAQASGAEEDVNDPLEGLNRLIFEFNEFFQAMLLRPASEFYTAFMPPPMREAVGNMLDNLRTPVILANDLLQGEGERAWQTTQRFVINSTWGVAGIVDRAEEMGIPKHNEDFGQTLAVWGVGEGFYLVLPLLGPSNPRDGIGKHLVDGYFDPIDPWLENSDHDEGVWARTAVGGVETYSGVADELAQIKKTSIDYYAAIRSMYRQKRSADIRNGADSEMPPIPDINYELSTTPSQ